MPGLDQPIVFERGDKLFIVGNVGVITPTDEEIANYSFAEQVKKAAPNPNLQWFRGQYVEADKANLNRVMWTAQELALKALTPMFMPVTVMHDPRTAVGVIADAALLTPEKDSVPRSKIDTTLALWAHRFPEAVEEALENVKAGTLMQSMECLAPQYECSVCGMGYVKMPGGFERENWCEHLRDMEAANASRILGNVVFTGTGLIYGTRGAQGADPQAHLEAFQDEVAELHTRWRHDQEAATYHTSRRTSTMGQITVEQSEWDRVQRERNDAIRERDEARTEKAEAEKKVETAEAAKAKAEGERDEFKTKAEQAEERAAKTTLRDERMGKLGAGFVAKLGETTKKNLTKHAETLSDDDWTARLEELSEAYGVKPDAKAEEKSEEKSEDETATTTGKDKDVFTEEEIAKAQFGGAPSSGDREPSAAERRAVLAGL